MSAEIAPKPPVELLWIPLGAGQRVVRRSGRIYERLVAAIERRPPRDLYHAALLLDIDGAHYAVEVAPIVDGDRRQRGVVAEGPVGLRWLGRFSLFRYEVRCRPDGLIPDAEFAALRLEVPIDPLQARAIPELAADVPVPVWGRDELGVGEMWNSNSVVAWLLAVAGADTSALAPPPNGRAPGWGAGLIVARDFDPGRHTAGALRVDS